MNRLLALVSVLALLAWTGLGLFAWNRAEERLIETAAGARADEADELAALRDELDVLHADVRALAEGMGQNLEMLRAELETRIDERRELLSVPERPAAREPDTVLAPQVVASELQASELRTPVSAPDPAPAASAAAPRKSFLAFQLPTDAFRFDERRTWLILPALSRVGFDGKSTLHDFSGVTSELAGEIEVDPSRPAEAPRGTIRVRTASLATGNEDRDRDMRKILEAERFPELVFELESFEPDTVDVAARRVAGRARGKMTVRAVTRPVTMPVELTVDDARRLVLAGETTLHLPNFGVAVPSKLGVITMEDDVKVWISLKLRAGSGARR